jgi:hypothetical protein
MPLKKSTTKKSKQRTTTARKGRIWHGEEFSNSGYMLTEDYDLSLSLSPSSNGNARKQPHRINPETEEQRDKRLAARKALTLKAARIAYENNHRRKAS